MSKSNTFEYDIQAHIFNNVAITGIGDTNGLPESATAGNLYVALYTSDPGEAGTAVTNECSDGGYARVAVPRSSAGFTCTASTGNVTNAATVTFGAFTTGATITHFGFVSTASGAGKLLKSGALTTSRTISAGTAPYFAAGDLTDTED